MGFLLPQPDCCAVLGWFLRNRFYTSFCVQHQLDRAKNGMEWKDNTMAKDFSVIVNCIAVAAVFYQKLI